MGSQIYFEKNMGVRKKSKEKYGGLKSVQKNYGDLKIFCSSHFINGIGQDQGVGEVAMLHIISHVFFFFFFIY